MARPGVGLHDRCFNFLSPEDEGNDLRGLLRESCDVGAGVDHLEISTLVLLFYSSKVKPHRWRWWPEVEAELVSRWRIVVVVAADCSAEAAAVGSPD